MKKQKLYYVDTEVGCTLIVARNIVSALKDANREYGSRFLREVRESTKEDIDHIRSMGGYIPDV